MTSRTLISRHESTGEFGRIHRDAVMAARAELVRFAGLTVSQVTGFHRESSHENRRKKNPQALRGCRSVPRIWSGKREQIPMAVLECFANVMTLSQAQGRLFRHERGSMGHPAVSSLCEMSVVMAAGD